MLLNLEREGRFDVLSDKLRLAPALTAALFSDVKIRTNPHSPTVRTDRIDQLIRARAWNDAAFALVELELLAWKLRRLRTRMASGTALFPGSRIYLRRSMTPPMRVTK